MNQEILYPCGCLAPAGAVDIALYMDVTSYKFPAIVDIAEQILIHIGMDIPYENDAEKVRAWKELLALMLEDVTLHEYLKESNRGSLITEWKKWSEYLEAADDTVPQNIDIKQFVFSARCAIGCYVNQYLDYFQEMKKKPDYLVKNILKKAGRARELIDEMGSVITNNEMEYLRVFYIMHLLCQDQILIASHKDELTSKTPDIIDRMHAETIISDENKQMLSDLLQVSDVLQFTSASEFYEYLFNECTIGTADRKKELLKKLLDIHYRIFKENLLTPESRMINRLSQLNGMLWGLFISIGIDLELHRKLVQQRIMSANLIRAYSAVKNHVTGDINEIAYDYGGADIITPLLLSDARVIRIRDLLPFGPEKQPDNEEFASLKEIFFMRFAANGFNGTELLWAIGYAKPAIYWSLEVLGASDIKEPRKGDVSKSEDPHAYYIEFSWSYDGNPAHKTDRVIIYKEMSLTKDSVERNSDDLKQADIYLRKAALREGIIPIPEIPMNPRYIITLRDEGEIDGYARSPINTLPGYPRGSMIFSNKNDKDYVDPETGCVYETIRQEKKTPEILWQVGEKVQQFDLISGAPIGDVQTIDQVDGSAEHVHLKGDPHASYVGFSVLNRRFHRICNSSL